MKKLKRILVLASIALFFAACSNSSNPNAESKTGVMQDTTRQQIAERTIYQCPMHLEEVSDKPGTCSKCGMDLEKVVIKGKDTLR